MRAVTVLLAVLLSATPALADFDTLLAAARSNDLAALKAELVRGTDPNAPPYHTSYVPLQFAAQHGDAEMVRLLLAAGAHTEYRDHNGDRALLWAALEGHAAVVDLLLRAGSPPDSDLDPYGETPLMQAARYGRADVAKLLLAAGADPNRVEQIGMTALHYAARTDSTVLVAALLRAGANPNVFDEVGFDTPLHEAAMYSEPKIIQLLLAASAVPSPRNREGKTPLHVAAQTGRGLNVAALLATWADFDVRDENGATPIITAMAQFADPDTNREQAVLLLAEYTTDLDRAFAAALRTGYKLAALRLLSRGADVNALDEDGKSALANSVHQPGLEFFQLLVERGADVDRFGVEALLAAADFGRHDIARLLIELGIAVDSRDARGATPLLLAAKGGHVETVAYLLSAGAEKVAYDELGFGTDDYMEIIPGFYEGLIESRSASRAWRPTEHIEIDLDLIRTRHAAIRKLLAAD